MPHAIFHIIFAIFVAELIREYLVKDKKKFPAHYIFIAGIAGALPDFDVAAFWVLNFLGYTLAEVHRTFTHTLFVPALFLILAFLTWNFKNKWLGERHMKLHGIFLMIVLGVMVHLILDSIIAGVIVPLYPFSDFAAGLNLADLLPGTLRPLFEPCLDAGIFILWLFWLEYKHKISKIF